MLPRRMLLAAAAAGVAAVTAAATTASAAFVTTTTASPSADDAVRARLRHLGVESVAAPAPVRSIYVDWRDVNWNAPNASIVAIADEGWNVIIMAFFLSSTGAADMAQAWASLDAATRAATLAYVHSKGAVLLVSAGGATDIPYPKVSGTAFGTAAATWAMENGPLDGVDIDAENLAPGFTYPPLADHELVAWLVNASVAVRAVMGPTALITHAPQAPYFGSVGGSGWPGPSGGYTAVYLQAAARQAISFFNTQFYNQGSCYLNYTSLFVESAAASSAVVHSSSSSSSRGSSGGGGEWDGEEAGASDGCVFPGTAVAEIASYGVPLSVLVVGKPLLAGDAGTGFVDPSDLHAFFEEAQKAPLKWAAGVMAWSWESTQAGPWINTVWPPSGEVGEEEEEV